MRESSIKKGQYITVESFFFSPFFIQKLKRSKYITLFTYCASCLEITEKEHTDKHFNQREMLHSLHLFILLLTLYGLAFRFLLMLTVHPNDLPQI